MIKLEHVVLPSPEQMEFIIEGMRNPMNSWDKSDSTLCSEFDGCERCPMYDPGTIDPCMLHTKPSFDNYILGFNDMDLMMRLSKAGSDDRKYMRMMPVMVRITAPLYWWKEFDTYKVGTVANSCSTMHKIMDKPFEESDFSIWNDEETFTYLIFKLNAWRIAWLHDKSETIWENVIRMLPNSYNQTRNVMLNYEVLKNIYHARKTHKLVEWRDFCKWIEELPYAKEIICNG